MRAAVGEGAASSGGGVVVRRRSRRRRFSVGRGDIILSLGRKCPLVAPAPFKGNSDWLTWNHCLKMSGWEESAWGRGFSSSSVWSPLRRTRSDEAQIGVNFLSRLVGGREEVVVGGVYA